MSGQQSPYRALMKRSLDHPATALGADILLITSGQDAYSFECKYGDASYVARNGYHQACTYGFELQLHHARRVTSYIVGPDSVVANPCEFTMNELTIGVIGPRHIGALQF